MAKRVIAFALGGGGARGALQVGALRALLEAGIKPDILVGTSIGACNATYLALNGVTTASIDDLENVWRDAAVADLLPPNYFWLTMRAVLRRQVKTHSEGRVRSFWLAHGITPEASFGQIQGVRLILVASDLNTGRTVLYGTSPEDSIFEGLLASSALPPWMRPIRRDTHLLIDGGFLCNLPIEPALAQGATDIIALDLSDAMPATMALASGLRPGMFKLAWSVQQRQIEMEMRLAAAYGVPVQRIALRADPAVPVWDFSHSVDLFAAGYEAARAALAGRPIASSRTRFWTARDWLARSASRVTQRTRAA